MDLGRIDLDFLLALEAFACAHDLLFALLVAIDDVRPFVRTDAHLISNGNGLVVIADTS